MKSQTLDKIHKLCTTSVSDGPPQNKEQSSNKDHSFNSEPPGAQELSHKKSDIIKTLQFNLDQEEVANLPPLINPSKYSFVTLLHHKRGLDNSININMIVADGYKSYNQYQHNRHKANSSSDLKHHIAFDDYTKQIPKGKHVCTRNGQHYDIDDLVKSLLNNDSVREPRNNDQNDSLWTTDSEEDMIIGHPGLSHELRSNYILKKQLQSDNHKLICDFLKRKPDILNMLGKYGTLFLNVRIDSDAFLNSCSNLLTIIGDDDKNPVLQFELFPNTKFRNILIDAINEKPAPQEFGYYLILLYFKLYHLMRSGMCSTTHEYVDHTSLMQQPDDLNIPLLPFFLDLSHSHSSRTKKSYVSNTSQQYCHDNIAYAGTAIIPLIDFNARDKIADAPNQSLSTINTLDKHHNVFLYLPTIDPHRLILTSHTLSDNLREDFEYPQELSKNKGLSLQTYYPHLIELINQNQQFFSNPYLTDQYINLFFSLHHGLNQ